MQWQRALLGVTRSLERAAAAGAAAADGGTAVLSRRAFRDVTLEEPATGEDACSTSGCSIAGGGAYRGPGAPVLGPVRSPQGTLCRRVLAPSPQDPFTCNVATLLLTPGGIARKCGTWRAVLNDPRFQQLFPCGPSPLVGEALGGHSLAEEGGTATCSPQLAALLELIDKLGGVERHLREDDDDDEEEEDATIEAVIITRAADVMDSTVTAHGAHGPWTARPLGRRRARPREADRGHAAGAQPFSTARGTVFGYWRIAPYG